tara:strand:+ start:51 stop:869 length:819 start_codon:yes stop_codon:yes gene_type:complete
MAKKLKDLGGKKYKEFSSISAAQKAGSIYYGKKLKSGKIEKKAAVLSTDLSKGQSLGSFMNEQLKGSKSTGANYKVKGIGKVRPKLRPKSGMKPIVDPKGQNVGKDTATFPEKIAGISRKDMLKIIDSSEPRLESSDLVLEMAVKKETAPTVKLQKLIESARSPAEVREIVKNSGVKISPDKMTTLLKKLKTAGLFDFTPTQPKPASKVEKIKPKRKVVSTKKRLIANAAVRDFMRKEFPERLKNIKVGDTVFFRTNAAGDPVVASIVKKGK